MKSFVHDRLATKIEYKKYTVAILQRNRTFELKIIEPSQKFDFRNKLYY
jgi:hypothetical protein